MYSLRGDLSRSASSVLGVKRSDVDDTVLRSVANSGLVVLDVSGNGLGDEFAEQLAAFIAYDKWLQACRLSGNGMTTKGASALLEGMLSNEGLVALDVRGNSCEGVSAALTGLFLFVPVNLSPCACSQSDCLCVNRGGGNRD